VWGNTYWPAGLIAAFAAFAVPELYALFTNAQNTLSDYCWRELSVNVAFGHGIHTAAWWFSLILWAAFVVTITGHIWWRSL
jgi:hypothetical protein